MHYHIILTKECNLDCIYCGGGSSSEPRELQYSVASLKKFLSRDHDPVISFYGGEPLLRIDAMKQIMDAVHGRFIIQTNGLFLERLDPQYLERIHSILVSIDGTREITDQDRGSGVYDCVIRNVEKIRQKGFRGDLVARMTVPQGSDISENVLHLMERKDFDHVHWQLAFDMFWEGAEPGLDEWICSYNAGITSLIEWWVSGMEQTGRVPGIVPFLGVMSSLLRNAPSRLRCGSGIDFFTIMPDGRISACPVSVDYDFSIIGSIAADAPASLCDKVCVGEPCVSCGVFPLCGGRCLFVNHVQDMLRDHGYSLICTSVRHLVNRLRGVVPRVRALIDRGILCQSDFDYPEVNNGCEIIP